MRILFIEPFHTGSHAELSRVLTQNIDARWTVLTLPGRHWKWRARGSAVYFATEHRDTLSEPYDLLFATSFLPLAELIGLHPQLSLIPRVLYFHENQLAYPVRDEHTGERDFHFGFSQLVAALAATRCVFNSEYNKNSFLEEGRKLLGRLPDAVPSNWLERIESRSVVLPVPLTLPDCRPDLYADTPLDQRSQGPIILWNHRWEHDKAPGVFFSALDKLARNDVPFQAAVCGEQFNEVPDEFARAQRSLEDKLVHFGYAQTREDYEALLTRAHIAVSTARQEFFGISMLEAAHFGARPVVPDRLAYREIWPAAYRYADDSHLAPTLARLCREWTDGTLQLREDRRSLTSRYGWPLFAQYEVFLQKVAALGR